MNGAAATRRNASTGRAAVEVPDSEAHHGGTWRSAGFTRRDDAIPAPGSTRTPKPTGVAEADFAGSLFDPKAVLAGLSDPAGRPAGRRLNVYRNNVATSLIDALAEGFPVTARLVGTAFFRAMALEFARAHPPDHPLMMHYGDRMPGFIAGHPPAASLPWLPDIAALELARRRSYHAADVTPADPGDLTPAAFERVRIALVPAAVLLRSRHPINGIWVHQTEDGPAPRDRAEAVLITRPEWDPRVDLLPPGGATFVAALNGATIADAAARATAAVPAFDLAATLGILLRGRAIAAAPPAPNEV